MVAGTGTNYLDGLPPSLQKAHTALPTEQPSPDEIWLRILQEVSAKNNNAVQGSLIFLGLFNSIKKKILKNEGNERSGKTSLVQRLTGGERRMFSSVLEYNYMQIQADADASYAYQLGGCSFTHHSFLNPKNQVGAPMGCLAPQIRRICPFGCWMARRKLRLS